MDLKTYYGFALDDYRFLCELKKTSRLDIYYQSF